MGPFVPDQKHKDKKHVNVQLRHYCWSFNKNEVTEFKYLKTDSDCLAMGSYSIYTVRFCNTFCYLVH